MLRMIDEMARAGVRRVNLLGGEPLLRDDIGVLVSRLASRKISVCILSNGSLLPRQIEEIQQVDEVGLSIDGCEETHDAIRGRGAFRALVEAIVALRQRGITVVLTYTMVASNLQELGFVMEFARRQGVYVTVNVAHGRVFGTRDVPVLRADNEAYRAALRELIGYRERGYPVFRAKRTLEFMLRWEDYQQDTSEIPPAKHYPRCSFGSHAATLACDGTLIPCFLNNRGSAGLSVPEHGFAAAWEHCRQIAHCTYCHVPCFIEYNSIFDLSPPVLFNAAMNLCVRPVFAKTRVPDSG
jgi:MoaA/NifB/PqqE/SkfB family radical SAM enzyme